MKQSENETKHIVQQQFGKHANSYVTSAIHAKGSDLEEMVSWLKPKKSDVALDVATGGGHVANALSPRVRQVIALDLTRPMLAAAKANALTLGLNNILYTIGDAEQLPFADESFELVTCRIAPHHFPNPEKFVQEVTRVLKQGGSFAITDNVAPEDKEAALFINEVEQLRDISHVWNAPVSTWGAWLAAANLTLVQERMWSKVFTFADWVSRTAETVEQQEAVEQRLLIANANLAQRFAIQVKNGHVESFATLQWMALCQKGADNQGLQTHSFKMTKLDHVQLSAPSGCETLARHFFADILEMKEIEKPAELKNRGGVWFQCGAHQIHVGVDSHFTPAKKAHPAIRVQNISNLKQVLVNHGISIQEDALLPGARRFYVFDPFGNRLEFLEWLV